MSKQAFDGSSGLDGEPGERAPRGQRELDDVLSERPRGWEYLYFAGVLNMEKEALEGKYLDHELGYAPLSEGWLDNAPALSLLHSAVTKLDDIVSSLVRMMEPDAQERAFGPPGVAGDPERIKHLASRWNSVYQLLLDWAARLRGTRHDDELDGLFETAVRLADKPIEQYRTFVDELAEKAGLLAGEQPVQLDVTLTITIDEDLINQLHREIRRIEQEVL